MAVKFPAKYGTHLPVLIKLLSITDGDVLELGTGIYSTPFLHWACYPDRRLWSYDNEPRYFEFAEQFQADYHKIKLIDAWDEVHLEHPWSVALVDQGPSTARVDSIIRLKDHAEYIVIHDTDWRQERHYHFAESFNEFKYRWDFMPLKTCWTTVVSNTRDLTAFKL